MFKILLAEDDDFLRTTTKVLLELQGFKVFAYPDGKLALDAFPAVFPDMIISDINMPELDGYGLLDGIRQLSDGEVVPFLFLSARSERGDVTHARELGADDYIFKPFEPEELVAAVQARLERRRVTELFDTRQAHLQTIVLLGNVIEARDAHTRGHVERVRAYALELGQALHWHPDELVILEYGALLHDVGKVSIPETVLNKPSGLTPEELVIIRSHTTAGAKIIEGITHLREALPYILYHHEKWDGTGYPNGLKGEAIPKEGRLLALADVYDALTSDRPYHHGMTFEEALDLIRREAGTHFDPQMAEVFVRIQQEKLQMPS
jgi:putative two-component system response regulator